MKSRITSSYRQARYRVRHCSSARRLCHTIGSHFLRRALRNLYLIFLNFESDFSFRVCNSNWLCQTLVNIDQFHVKKQCQVFDAKLCCVGQSSATALTLISFILFCFARLLQPASDPSAQNIDRNPTFQSWNPLPQVQQQKKRQFLQTVRGRRFLDNIEKAARTAFFTVLALTPCIVSASREWIWRQFPGIEFVASRHIGLFCLLLMGNTTLTLGATLRTTFNVFWGLVIAVFNSFLLCELWVLCGPSANETYPSTVGRELVLWGYILVFYTALLFFNIPVRMRSTAGIIFARLFMAIHNTTDKGPSKIAISQGWHSMGWCLFVLYFYCFSISIFSILLPYPRLARTKARKIINDLSESSARLMVVASRNLRGHPSIFHIHAWIADLDQYKKRLQQLPELLECAWWEGFDIGKFGYTRAAMHELQVLFERLSELFSGMRIPLRENMETHCLDSQQHYALLRDYFRQDLNVLTAAGNLIRELTAASACGSSDLIEIRGLTRLVETEMKHRIEFSYEFRDGVCRDKFGGEFHEYLLVPRLFSFMSTMCAHEVVAVSKKFLEEGEATSESSSASHALTEQIHSPLRKRLRF